MTKPLERLSDQTHRNEEVSNAAQTPCQDNRELVGKVLAADYTIFRRLALKRVRNRGDAEDVLQSFCLKALARAHQLRDMEAVHGWLRRLFETTLLDHFRASARLKGKASPFEYSDAPPEDLPSAVFFIDEAEAIEDVLSRLRPDYAEAIREMDLGQEKPSRIAARRAITPNNLAVRLHRARRAFRNAVAETPIVLQA